MSLNKAIQQAIGRGEACYLKAGEQTAECRLFGCDEASRQIMTTSLPLAPRVGLCKKHAGMVRRKEITLAGIAGKPVSR